MPEDNSIPGWFVGLLTAAISGTLAYLGIKRVQQTEQRKTDNVASVELLKVDADKSKVVIDAFRSMFDGMKGRITELELSSERKSQSILELTQKLIRVEAAQAECNEKHDDCEARVVALTTRVAGLEKKNESAPSR